jgi:glycosyltransferase involved in cell wall biosynthesis
LWVIGRWPQEIRWWSARTFPPDRGAAIAALLRQCHVYVTASLWESGPMHVIEGIQCGLPVLYHENGGGVVEIARRFGIGFSHDIQSAIAAMRARHEELRREVLIEPPSGDRMCGDYQRLILQVMDMKRYARTVAHQDPEPA